MKKKKSKERPIEENIENEEPVHELKVMKRNLRSQKLISMIYNLVSIYSLLLYICINIERHSSAYFSLLRRFMGGIGSHAQANKVHGTAQGR